MDLYLNPAHVGESLHIKLHGQRTGELQLFDSLGRLVLSRHVSRETTLLTSELHPGMYVVSLRASGEIRTTQVVVY